MNASLLTFLAACGALIAGVACQARAPELDEEPACAPVSGALPAGTRAEPLAGTHRVTLVAVTGPSAGRSVSGRVSLTMFDSASPYPRPSPALPGSVASYPLHGRTDLMLDSIGAAALGAGRTDPALPGVLVVTWEKAPPQSGTGITLRFGAEANRPGVVRFDGAFTALHVSNLTDSSFAGTWVTGGAQPPGGGGHFCARRAAGTS